MRPVPGARNRPSRARRQPSHPRPGPAPGVARRRPPALALWWPRPPCVQPGPRLGLDHPPAIRQPGFGVPLVLGPALGQAAGRQPRGLQLADRPALVAGPLAAAGVHAAAFRRASIWGGAAGRARHVGDRVVQLLLLQPDWSLAPHWSDVQRSHGARQADHLAGAQQVHGHPRVDLGVRAQQVPETVPTGP